MNSILPALSISVLLLSSCASLPVIDAMGPGGANVQYDTTGFTINQQGYNHLRAEGVPDSDFTITPLGWHMTNLQWHDAHRIQLERANAIK